MKKFLLTITILSIAFTAKSQSIKYGVSIFYYGAQYSNGVFSNGQKNKVPFSGALYISPGLFAEKRLTKVLTARLELNFMGKSMSASGFSTVSDNQSSATYLVERDYSLMYLQVPLLAKFTATKRINIYAGPSLGYILNRKMKAFLTADR